jgi:hypothetical protein
VGGAGGVFGEGEGVGLSGVVDGLNISGQWFDSCLRSLYLFILLGFYGVVSYGTLAIRPLSLHAIVMCIFLL